MRADTLSWRRVGETFLPEAGRRIAAILLLTPRLDASYLAAKANPLAWSEGRPVAS